MNKNDLVVAVAKATDLGKADVARAVDGVFEVISGALKAGNGVKLHGFGTFRSRSVPPVRAATRPSVHLSTPGARKEISLRLLGSNQAPGHPREPAD